MQKKLRVAAYARVSADSTQMQHSLQAQMEYYREFIHNNPDWEHVGIYADKGITGTSTEK